MRASVLQIYQLTRAKAEDHQESLPVFNIIELKTENHSRVWWPSSELSISVVGNKHCSNDPNSHCAADKYNKEVIVC